LLRQILIRDKWICLGGQAVITPKSTALISTATTAAKVRTAVMGFSFSLDHVDGMQFTRRATHA
jgi:hypothetical protein